MYNVNKFTVTNTNNINNNNSNIDTVFTLNILTP